MTATQVVHESPTERQRELARKELAHRNALREAKLGTRQGPMSPEWRQKISEGVKRARAERKAALEAVMREAEAAAAHGLQE